LGASAIIGPMPVDRAGLEAGAEHARRRRSLGRAQQAVSAELDPRAEAERDDLRRAPVLRLSREEPERRERAFPDAYTIRHWAKELGGDPGLTSDRQYLPRLDEYSHRGHKVTQPSASMEYPVPEHQEVEADYDRDRSQVDDLGRDPQNGR
jgi:hypothetical protein